MKRVLGTVSAVALASCLGLGGARAQSDDVGAAEGQPSPEAGAQSDKQPNEITCQEVIALETARIPAVLYFISGFDSGQQQGGPGGTDQQAQAETEADPAAAQDATATQTSDGEEAEASGSGAESDAAGEGDAGGEAAPAQASEGGAPDASGEGDAASPQEDAPDAGDAASPQEDASGGGDVSVVGVIGFYEIPMEQTMIACAQAPERRASDVVREQRQSGG